MEPSLLWLATLLLKLTIVAIGAWLADFSLRTVNPRWRVGLWRVALVAGYGLVAAAFVPPFYRWEFVRTATVEPRPVVAAADPPSGEGDESLEQGRDTRPAYATSTEGSPATIVDMAEADRPPFDDSSPASSASLPTEPSSVPEAVPSLDVRPRFYWQQLAILVWVGGAALGLARLALGVVRVRRVVARSEDVSEATLTAARCLAERLRVALPDVRSSSDVTSPVLYGRVRPTILLPRAMAEETKDAELEAALAHELAHVAGRDAWWDLAMRLAACAAWPHPLAWRAPAAHRQACDRVSDLVAAEAVGDRGTYGRSLAQIALRVAETPPGAGLAMARRADVVERVRLIASDVRAAALGRRGWVATSLVGLAVIALGGFAIALTTRTVAADEPEPPFELEVVVLDAKDDSPIAGAEVHALLSSPYSRDAKLDSRQSTEKEGKVRFAYPDADSASIRFWAHKKGFAPHYANLDTQPRASFPKSRVVRLSPGTKVGGTVVFNDGTPVANASFSILATSAETLTVGSHHRIGEGTTDAEGRWEFDGIPKSDQPCAFSVVVPDSAAGVSFVTIEPTTDQRTVVERWRAAGGVVRDAASGEPLAGVKITANQGRGFFGSGTTTDEDGKFRLTGLLPRYQKDAALVASRDGYAAQTAPIPNGEGDLDPIEFRLSLGKRIRVRVLDGDGEPLDNALVHSASIDGFGLSQWRGQTNAAGEVTWDDAPERGLAITVFGKGHAPAGDVALDELPLNDGAYEIKLERALTVDGTIVDDATGEPIPQCVATFRVLSDPRSSNPRWFPRESTLCLDGRFELSVSYDEKPMSLMIEAEGYESWTSEPLPPRNHHETFAVRLKRASEKPEPTPEPTTVAGRVLAPDGKSDSGVPVQLTFPPSASKTAADTVPTRWTQLKAVTDEGGRFEFEYPPFPDAEGGLQVECDAGYGIASLVDVRRGEPIRLRGWARLEVVVLSGAEPKAFERIRFESQGYPRLAFGFSGRHEYATTDEKGVAVFERVPEGKGTVNTSVVRELKGGGGVGTDLQMLNVELKSGETKRVQLGGVGRPVIGRIVLPPDPPMPHAWERSGFGMISSSKVEYGDPAYRRFGFQVSSDGTLRVEDVPAGTYELSIRLQGDLGDEAGLPGPYVGNVEFGPFDVEATDAEADAEPRDLGTIRGEWIDYLKAGDVLPPFAVRGVDGRAVSSVDLAGKPFVLNFWNPGDEASEATMRTLAEVRKKRHGEVELPIVSIATDPMAEAAKRTARSNGWDWTVAGRSEQGPFRYAFDLLASPTVFVVGADGVVRYRGTDKDAIKAVIAAEFERETKNVNPSSAWRTSMDDAGFESTMQVSAIMSLSSAYVGEKALDNLGPKVVFVAADGKTIRDMPVERSTATAVVDPRRDRFYVLGDFATCTAFDRTGRKLFSLNVPSIAACDVDPQTGDLLIAVGGIEESAGWTLVFDLEGRLKSARPGGTAALRFEPDGRRTWFAGERLRATDRDGNDVVNYPTSFEGRSRYSDVSIDSRGVAWAVEQSYGSGGSSDRRIRRCDENGIETSLELSYTRGVDGRELNRWLTEVGDEIWIGVDRYEGESKRTGRIVRFDATGKRLPDLDRSLQGAASNGAGLWGWEEGRLLRVDAAGTIQQSYHLEDDLPAGATRNASIACFPAE